MLDSEDERTVYPLWKELDRECEKIAWKFISKIDKLVETQLGYPTDQESKYQRFESLCLFIEDVYLKPILDKC